MGLMDFIKGQCIEVIEWTDDSSNVMVWRFPDDDKEIKMGAQLTVRESQMAVFVNEGQVADVFGPGRYELETQNMPLLTKLESWPHGFNSPFKAEVYFVNTKQFTDQKWGTSNPIMMRDAEYGVVRLRGYGTYSFKVTDPLQFLKEVFGTNSLFTVEEISGQLKSKIVSGVSDYIAESKIPAPDLAMNYDELSEGTGQKLKPRFKEYGFELVSFHIENLSLPPEVEKMIDKRTSMGVIGDVKKYAQFQMADSIDDFAKKEGGGSVFTDMGMGAAMGQQMGNMMNQMSNTSQQPQGGSPPPPPPVTQYYIAVNGQQQGPYDMNSFRQLISQGHITRATLVWKNGMANWAAASTVAELASLFGAVPPPPPPPIG